MIYRYFLEYKLYDIQIYLYEMRSGTPKATDDILCSILSSVHMWAGIGISVTIVTIIITIMTIITIIIMGSSLLFVINACFQLPGRLSRWC